MSPSPHLHSHSTSQIVAYTVHAIYPSFEELNALEFNFEMVFFRDHSPACLHTSPSRVWLPWSGALWGRPVRAPMPGLLRRGPHLHWNNLPAHLGKLPTQKQGETQRRQASNHPASSWKPGARSAALAILTAHVLGRSPWPSPLSGTPTGREVMEDWSQGQ